MNREKGEVALPVGDQTYRLKFDFNSLVELEDVTGLAWEELEKRLRGRGTEPEDVIARRLAAGRIEMAAEQEFDLTLVNTSVQDVCHRLIALLADAPEASRPGRSPS